MTDPEHLRTVAVRMLATALETSDEELARTLAERASEYFDRAAAIEAAKPSVADGSGP
jgi:hypothetical protein